MARKCEGVGRMRVVADHIVQLFDTEPSRAKAVAAFVADGLDAGDTVLVVARPKHWRGAARRLKRTGFSVDEALFGGRLVVLDASTTLASFMRRGAIDTGLFDDVMASCVAGLAARAERRLRIYAEMVDLLAEENNLDAAHELEELWNGLAERHGFTLLCGYSAAHFSDPRTAKTLCAICDSHTRVESAADDLLGNWVLRKSVKQRSARAILPFDINFRLA